MLTRRDDDVDVDEVRRQMQRESQMSLGAGKTRIICYRTGLKPGSVAEDPEQMGTSRDKRIGVRTRGKRLETREER